MLLHRLETLSTPLSLPAENLMDVLKEHPDFTRKIEQVKEQTKSDKKKKAMAMRAKQLQQLGMTSGKHGKIEISKTKVEGLGSLESEELVCCICKEGYLYEPKKVLGIYTFSKSVQNVSSTMGRHNVLHTVSHFNLVHVQCHQNSVKGSKGEWEKAMRHNADTRCNSLLPIWGPKMPESVYSTELARHTARLCGVAASREITPLQHAHEMKCLLLKFATETSFSEESKGGGRDSNMRLYPYLVQLTLFKLTREGKAATEVTRLGKFVNDVNADVMKVSERGLGFFKNRLISPIPDQRLLQRSRQPELLRLHVPHHQAVRRMA